MSEITLEEWDRRKFDPPHSIRTLRLWARTGRIHPQPVLVGREYRVQEDAVFVPAKRRRPSIKSISVLKSKDPVVHDIITSGKTQKLRQA